MAGQSLVPNYNYNIIRAKRLNIAGPRVIDGGANEVKTIFLDDKKSVLRSLQNCGTSAVKFCIGANPTINQFHGILAGCAAADDGLGSILDCSDYQGEIRVWSADAWRVCAFEAFQG